MLTAPMRGIAPLSYSALVLTARLSLAATQFLFAHEDMPGVPLGEYRVTLSNVKVFDEEGAKEEHGLDGSGTPELLIHTFTEAATHSPGVHYFRNFGSQELPATLNIGDLIYYHVDCIESENLRMFIEVIDEDTGLGELTQKLIELGKKIVPPTEPEIKAALDIAGGLLEVFEDELRDMGERFTFEAPGGFVHPDHFPPTTVTVNADTAGVGIFTSPPEPGEYGGEKLFEFTWSAQYVEIPDTACSTTTVTTRYKDVSKAEADAAKAIAEIIRSEEETKEDKKQSNKYGEDNKDSKDSFDDLKEILDLLGDVSPSEMPAERWAQLNDRVARQSLDAARELAEFKMMLAETDGINTQLARQKWQQALALINQPQRPPEAVMLQAVDLFAESWLFALNAPHPPGDANGDMAVNLEDFSLLKANFGGAGPVGDFNGDVAVNLADFSILKNYFGQQFGAAVPEPASLSLAAVGLALWAGYHLGVARRR
jgi:hypothetical protein